MKSRMYFCDLEFDHPIVMTVLVHHVTEKTSRSGSPFCNLTLSDGRSKIDAVAFNTTADCIFEELGSDHGLLCVTLVKTVYGNGISYKIQDYCENVDDYSIKDFVLHAPVDPDVMYDFILSGCDQVSEKMSGNLASLVSFIYEQHKGLIQTWAAGKSMHHAYRGGLLYHTYRMFCSGIGILPAYPNLDAELLLCGIALHDIGKLVEFETDDIGHVTYNPDGNLFGHLHLGSNLISDAAHFLVKEDQTVYETFPKLKLLQHMIVSHHGKQEWGAVMKPGTLEAYVLSSLDYMDTKIDQYDRALADTEDGQISDPYSMLDGACVFQRDYTIDASFYPEFAGELLKGVKLNES